MLQFCLSAKQSLLDTEIQFYFRVLMVLSINAAKLPTIMLSYDDRKYLFKSREETVSHDSQQGSIAEGVRDLHNI